MKRSAPFHFACLLLGDGMAWGQNSSMLNGVSKYLPSLIEIGFVTGGINSYIQTAILVRAVNKEIASAKSISKRLDDLKYETNQMVWEFGPLSQIEPYNMDSWAAWLLICQIPKFLSLQLSALGRLQDNIP
jgi:hypothetical protein